MEAAQGGAGCGAAAGGRAAPDRGAQGPGAGGVRVAHALRLLAARQAHPHRRALPLPRQREGARRVGSGSGSAHTPNLLVVCLRVGCVGRGCEVRTQVPQHSMGYVSCFWGRCLPVMGVSPRTTLSSIMSARHQVVLVWDSRPCTRDQPCHGRGRAHPPSLLVLATGLVLHTEPNPLFTRHGCTQHPNPKHPKPQPPKPQCPPNPEPKPQHPCLSWSDPPVGCQSALLILLPPPSFHTGQ